MDLDLDNALSRNCIRVTGTRNNELDIDIQQLTEKSHEHEYVLRYARPSVRTNVACLKISVESCDNRTLPLNPELLNF